MKKVLGLLCPMVGHHFVNEHGSQQVVQVRQMHTWGGGETYDALQVFKACKRCGYRHSEVFRIPEHRPRLDARNMPECTFYDLPGWWRRGLHGLERFE